MTTRIVLADDHSLVRESLALLLGSARGFEVVAQAGDLWPAAVFRFISLGFWGSLRQ